MGCFLACFGLSKKRKRRKPFNRTPLRDQKHGSYQPLDSDLYPNTDETTENPNRSKSDSRFLPNPGLFFYPAFLYKDHIFFNSSFKIIKKVTFNLNVKTYEPLPSVDFTSYFSDQEKEEETMEWSHESELSAYPENYRYRNCIEDEEDDLEIYKNSDTEEEEEEEEDTDSNNNQEHEDDYEENYVKITEELGSATMEKRFSSMPGGASLDQELKKLGMYSKATTDRSQFVFSVLNPVENLSQWKEMKAKSRKTMKHRSKENIPFPKQTKPLLHDDAVNASLSNWLVLSKARLNTTI